jgi:hypothetical protein
MSKNAQDNAGIPQDVIDANEDAERDLEKFRKPPPTAPKPPEPKKPEAPVAETPAAPAVEVAPENGADAEVQTKIQALEAELAEGQRQRKKYDQTVGRLGTELRAEREERLRIESELAVLREQVAAKVTAPDASEASATEAMFSDEEATEWGEPLLSIVVRIARRIAAEAEARLSGIVKPVTERIEATERRNAVNEFERKVEELAPGFLAANVVGSEFDAWLDVERDVPLVPGSHRTRKEKPRDVATKAAADRDFEKLAELYNTFVAEGEQAPSAPEQVESPGQPAAAAPVAPTPHRQAKPTPEPVQARGASGKPAGVKPRMKQSEYVAFMNEASMGRKTDKEVADYEAQQEQAIREKRFDFNG